MWYRSIWKFFFIKISSDLASFWMKTAQTACCDLANILANNRYAKQKEMNQNCYLWYLLPETEVNVTVACRNNGPDLQQEVETLRREVAALRLQQHLVGVPATFSLNLRVLCMVKQATRLWFETLWNNRDKVVFSYDRSERIPRQHALNQQILSNDNGGQCWRRHGVGRKMYFHRSTKGSLFGDLISFILSRNKKSHRILFPKLSVVFCQFCCAWLNFTEVWPL